MIAKIGNVKLDYRNYKGSDLYSDGAVEDELLDIVKNYEEKDFDEIIAKKQNWAYLYHLSKLRHNILEWFPFKTSDSVLEIGSGCGAITGCLAEKCGSVTCVELSQKRSLINASRNRDRDNIQILVGNFEDIEKDINQKFDYITLIGVYEYAESYISGDAPYEKFLSILKKHLKPSGKIIIAIENKLGMKYWAGCKEDHTNMFFEGLEGYSNTNGVRTFSRRELEKILNKVGLNSYKFYYPYPDYKFPSVIYSDEYLPEKGQLNINICNFDMDRLRLFDETRVFNQIIEEKVFPVFSNSYLICAGAEG